MNPKRYHAVLFILLLCSAMGISQVPRQFVFYTPDTLQGFDVNTSYKDMQLYAQRNHLNPLEQLMYMRAHQEDFVEHKYGIVRKTKKAVTVPPVVTTVCNNLGFETGDYTGWTGGVGYNFNSNTPLTITSPAISTMGINYPEPYCAYHTLVTAAAGNDPYGAFPMLDPAGGTYALRLGGEWINLNGPQTGDSCTSGKKVGGQYYAGGEFVQQTFLVTSANAMFNYNYAVILDKATHANGECPYFRAEVLDSAGNPIPCLQYYVQSDSTNTPSGMQVSSVMNGYGGPVFYLGWTSNSLNLRPYLNHHLTVRFTAAGCTHGGHFGYAYVDASCSPVQVLASSPSVCLGGTITLTAPGASASGTYAWNTMPSGTVGIVGSTTGQTVTVNASGTYQVTVTQAPGCFYTIDTTIAFYPNPTLTLTSTNPTCPSGTNGTASATVTGGNPPLTYSWSPAPGAGQGTGNATGLGGGTYSLTVTTTNGCSASASVTLAPAPPAPTVTFTSTPATCSPGHDGSATATVTGGTGPFTYSWIPAPGGGQGTTSATGLNGGTYTLVVTGAPGTCVDSATVTITQPNGPTTTPASTNVICFGQANGTAGVTATGGTAPLTYSWTGTASVTNTATGLSAGTYTCTTSDSKGCTVNNVITITQPALLAVTATGVAATCNNKCNGQLICIPTGGTTTYTYSWSSGSTAPSVSNICAGTYTATITDAHGCTATDTALVQQPTPLVMNVFPGKTHCNKSDGMDSATVSGGTPGYTYSWSPGPGSATSTYHNIPAGTYTVYIKDNNGCPDSIQSTVVNLPGVNLVTVSSTNVTCAGGNNGAARDSASGGFKPYTFNWTPAPAVGQGTLSISGLTAGTYVCMVTDSAGCTNSVPVTITQPTPVTVASGPAKICLGSCTTLSATGSGGTPAYTYT
ncbi:MAG TPA: hypothetical protein VNZ86_11605, partial [Bacteroidia bacterium]|nr:hypothetical protein [Bacteroidia bacterium]